MLVDRVLTYFVKLGCFNSVGSCFYLLKDRRNKNDFRLGVILHDRPQTKCSLKELLATPIFGDQKMLVAPLFGAAPNLEPSMTSQCACDLRVLVQPSSHRDSSARKVKKCIKTCAAPTSKKIHFFFHTQFWAPVVSETKTKQQRRRREARNNCMQKKNKAAP